MKLKDSGKRVKYFVGGLKEPNEGRGDFSLLPPRAIRELAIHFQNGTEKYGARNWEQGLPMSRVLDSLLRHTFQFLEGKKDEDHLRAICWNAMVLMEYRERIKEGKLPKEIDDLQK